jgi:uncharacterized protein (TIGR00661 family)
VAPLDWGLGHATRDISIIRALVANGYEVVLAAEGIQAALLQTEFPELDILPLGGYHIHYSKTKWGFLFTILQQIPRVYGVIGKENRWLDTVIDEHKINLVISDNRFGLHSKKVPCIFITHQLTVKAPFAWLEKMMQQVNYHFINQFSCCWVPDVSDDKNIAGILSHPVTLPKIPVHYIGLVSRFQIHAEIKQFDYCVLLSGPEPQRTMLEKKILADAASINGKILLVRGKPGSNEVLNVPQNVAVTNHLPTTDLQKALLQSDIIVCRGGYTSVMELLSLKKKMLVIPTPGQTEQEYLAVRLMEEKICLSTTQDKLNCTKDFALAKEFQYQFPDFTLFKEEQMVDLVKRSL